MIDIFNRIPNIDGEYYISENGVIMNRFKKILKHRTCYGGYKTVYLRVDGKRKDCKIHHLVMESWGKPRLYGLECNHIDGDKSNNCISNLEWVTRSENQKHSYRVLGKNSYAKGKPCANRKLSDAKIKRIKFLRNKVKHGEWLIYSEKIAKSLGVSKFTIRAICGRENYISYNIGGRQ